MSTLRQPLPADCLLGGRVHPSILERLERIRQLPVATVANYLGLEQDAECCWLCWQDDGSTSLQEIHLPPGTAPAMIEQLRQIAAAMHSHGIVHGAIDARSVRFDSQGRVRLSLLSPLLYDDPSVDRLAIDRLAESLGIVPDQISVQAEEKRIERLRRRQRAAAVLWTAIGALIFAGLLWYSQGL